MTALMEHKLAPVTDPALENLDFGEEGPLKFDLVVEVRPEIELGDLDGLPVKQAGGRGRRTRTSTRSWSACGKAGPSTRRWSARRPRRRPDHCWT